MSIINILVVEDEIAIAEMLSDMLLDMGYGVSGVAHTGPDAVRLARETQPDLILMDIQLRGPIDGIDAARQIAEHQTTALMFLTAFSDTTTIARARAASPYGYLVKPFDEGALRAAIETTIHRARSDRRRAAAERQLANTLTSMGDAVVTTNVDGRITFFNPVAVALTGWQAHEVIGKYVDGVMQLRDEHGLMPDVHPVAQVLRSGEMTSLGPHARLLQRSGTLLPIDDHASPIRDEQGRITGVVLVVRDTTVQHQIEQQLSFAALHDALTLLPNRVLLFDRLQAVFEESRRTGQQHFAVVFVDLDHFKLINDSLGHMVGDRVLIEVAARLASCTRACDTVARMGGDEFVLLLTSVTFPDEVLHITERVRKTMAAPFQIDDHTLYCTASIGVRYGNAADLSVEALLRDADVALYGAKARGRNQYAVFEPSMQAAVSAQLSLENDLREAWQNNQFTLEFQPIVATKTAALYGFEALLRWSHPRRGRVSPDEFIMPLEEMELMCDVGDWVIVESCRQLAVLRGSALVDEAATMFINLSVRQFRCGALVAHIQDTLARFNLPPYCVQFEITESIALADNQVRKVLDELRAIGVRLALDDFGTGYSSLVALHELPISTLKIDRSFIRGVETNTRQRSMVRALVRMSNELDLVVVAEGVETGEQWRVLADDGCTYSQGYLFARPMAPADLHAWLRKGPVALAR